MMSSTRVLAEEPLNAEGCGVGPPWTGPVLTGHIQYGSGEFRGLVNLLSV